MIGMSKLLTTELGVEIVVADSAVEVIATIAFRASPGCPDYYDRRLGHYLPGDPPAVEIESMTLDKGPCPDWLADIIRNAEGLDERLFEAASEARQQEREAADELRWELARDDG